MADPFQPQNAVDGVFSKLLEYIWTSTEQELLQGMIGFMEQLPEKDRESFVSYFARFPLWGTLDPEHGDYTTLKLRAQVLKRHSYDFLWLYRRLEDYMSKRHPVCGFKQLGAV